MEQTRPSEMTPAKFTGTDLGALTVRLVGDARSVLELSPSEERVARPLRELGCQIIAIERDRTACAALRTCCTSVIQGDVHQLHLGQFLRGRQLDAVVLGSQLQRTLDPAALLKKLAPLIASGGALVATVTNLAHASLRLALLKGMAPTLHETKGGTLRLLPLQQLEDALAEAGLVLDKVERIVVDPYQQPFLGIPAWDPGAIPNAIRQLLDADPEATVGTYVLRAVPALSELELPLQREERAPVDGGKLELLDDTLRQVLQEQEQENAWALQASQDRLAAARKELREAQELAGKRKLELESSAGQLAELQLQLQRAEDLTTVSERRLQQERVRWQAEQEALVGAQQTELSRVKTELDRARHDREEATIQTKLSRNDGRRLETQLKELWQALLRAEEALQERDSKLEHAGKGAAELQAQLRQSQQSYLALEEQALALAISKEELEEELVHATAEWTHQLRRVAELESALSSKHEELAAAQGLLTDQAAQITALEQRAAAAEQAHAAGAAELEQRSEQLDALTQQEQQLQDRISSLESESVLTETVLQGLETQLTEQATRLAQAHREATSACEQVEEQRQELLQARAAIEELTAERTGLGYVLEDRDRAVRDLVAERDGFRQALGERDKSISELLAASDQLRRTLDQQERLVDELTAERDGLSAERASLTGERDGLAATRDSLRETLAQRDWTIGELTAERDGLYATRNELAATRDALFATRDELAATRDELAAERDSLRETLAQRDWTIGELTAERDGLYATRDALAATRDELAATRDALAATRDELAATRDELAATRDDLAATRDALAAERDSLRETLGQRDWTIGELTAEREGLLTEREALRDTLSQREQLITESSRKVSEQLDAIGQLEQQLLDLTASQAGALLEDKLDFSLTSESSSTWTPAPLAETTRVTDSEIPRPTIGSTPLPPPRFVSRPSNPSKNSSAYHLAKQLLLPDGSLRRAALELVFARAFAAEGRPNLSHKS